MGIVILEQDRRRHANALPWWRFGWFRGCWAGGRTWRLGWGNWSICYYPSPGLHDFFRHVEAGNTGWCDPSKPRTETETNG